MLSSRLVPQMSCAIERQPGRGGTDGDGADRRASVHRMLVASRAMLHRPGSPIDTRRPVA